MIALKYALCAAAATAANLLAQAVFFMLFDPQQTFLAGMAFGTVVGLVLKYVLDKKFIFDFRSPTLSEDTKTFLMYSAVGVFTTAIFWGFELAFNAYWDTPMAKYVGGAIGLSIGYSLKYAIDKRVVFIHRE